MKRISIYSSTEPVLDDGESTAWDALACINIPCAPCGVVSIDIEAGFNDEASARAWTAQLEKTLDGASIDWDNHEDHTHEPFRRQQVICDSTNKRITTLEMLIRDAYPFMPPAQQHRCDDLLSATGTAIETDTHREVEL